MSAMLLGLVVVATAIIGAFVLWGAHNGTLFETEEDSFDHRFHQIAMAEAYSRFPRMSDSRYRAIPQAPPLH